MIDSGDFSSSCQSSELKPGDYAALIGIDWGDQKHAVAISVRGSLALESLTLEHSAETLHTWLDQLQERFAGQPVAVAVEASRGAVVAALLERPWLVIYPIHPTTSTRFRNAFSPGGAKDDMPDAHTLLELLQTHRHRLRVLIPHDEQTRELALLAEARRKAVDRRALLLNQTKSLLKNYFPQALELAGTRLDAPMALEFLQRWPDLPALQRAKPSTLRAFYFKHNVRRPELVDARLARVRTARALCSDQALYSVSRRQLALLVAEIRILTTHIEDFENRISEVFAAHPEAYLFDSLPGAGASLAPRLCTLFGTDRERWPDAASLQRLTGVAPITEKSGTRKWIHWRWQAPKFLRQTLVEWSAQSAIYSQWARAYYQQQKASGKRHWAILRALAFKWLRILWRCWNDRIAYDESAYIAKLRQRNSTLIPLIDHP